MPLCRSPRAAPRTTVTRLERGEADARRGVYPPCSECAIDAGRRDLPEPCNWPDSHQQTRSRRAPGSPRPGPRSAHAGLRRVAVFAEARLTRRSNISPEHGIPVIEQPDGEAPGASQRPRAGRGRLGRSRRDSGGRVSPDDLNAVHRLRKAARRPGIGRPTMIRSTFSLMTTRLPGMSYAARRLAMSPVMTGAYRPAGCPTALTIFALLLGEPSPQIGGGFRLGHRGRTRSRGLGTPRSWCATSPLPQSRGATCRVGLATGPVRRARIAGDLVEGQAR